MIMPNPRPPEPPPDDANRPLPPPDTHISATPPTPSSEPEPFPVEERPSHRPRSAKSLNRARNIIAAIWLLTFLSCLGAAFLLCVVCREFTLGGKPAQTAVTKPANSPYSHRLSEP